MDHIEARPVRVPSPEDWLHCRRIAREHGRSFYLASRTLPPGRQRGVLATYAFCRVADDIVDRAGSNGLEATAETLAHWETELDSPAHPVAVAFAHTRLQYGVPVVPAHDMIKGIRMDLQPVRFANWNELRRYCHYVAGTVGLMVAPILGCQDPGALRHAADLGIAMQLTNILRDVAEDAEAGRLYLPIEELAAFGCDPEDVMAGRPGPGFPDFMAFQIDRARALYAEAMRGVPALAPSGRLATLAASRLYAGILTEIEGASYDVFWGRVHVAGRQKLKALARVVVDYTRASTRGSARTPERRALGSTVSASPMQGELSPHD